jgi:hypothetical protein
MQEIGSSLGGLCKRVDKLNTSVEEMKTAVSGKIGKMEDRFEKVENQLLKIKEPRFSDDEMESARSDQATAADLNDDTKFEKNAHDCAYLVAGGVSRGFRESCISEIFDRNNNCWIELQPMKTCRSYASSVVYDGRVLVTGGTSNASYERNILNSIEQYSRNVNPLVPPCWSDFTVNLPRALSGHRTVVYHDRMLVVGGYDAEKKDYSDIIYEIQLSFPFITKLLAKLPFPRPMGGCGVVLVEDKIFIFGGRASEKTEASTANVTMYDITKNEFKELAPLPYEVCDMATAKYEENVILAGGFESSSDGSRRNTVVSYNLQTQKSTMIPPMKDSRSDCCAVVDGDSLVVMGGENQKIRRKGKDLFCLDSVETFNFKTSEWSSLPAMKGKRKGFIAEIV